MPTVHTYSLTGHWSGSREGSGEISTTGLHTPFSIPHNLKGAGSGTNPEELLLAAASSCYLITLSLILANRKIQYSQIQLESKGFVEDDKGLRFDRIEHLPTIIFDQPVDEQEVHSLALHAEHACMVSSAVRGNVSIHVKSKIFIKEASR